MPFRTLDVLSEPGSPHKANEDLVLAIPGMCVVLDGATGLGRKLLSEEASDAQWFVRALGYNLRSAWQHPDFATALRAAVHQTAKVFSHKTRGMEVLPHEQPSASLVALVLEQGKPVLYQASDCFAVSMRQGIVKKLLPPCPLQALDDADLSQMRQFIEQGSTPEQARAQVAERIVAKRSSMNTAPGYPSVSTQPDSPSALVRVEMDLEPGTEILLMSDGFEMFFAYQELTRSRKGYSHCPSLAAGASLRTAVEWLRMCERIDAGMKDLVRFKLHDDASAIRLQIT
jgi:hypothetical protein